MEGQVTISLKDYMDLIKKVEKNDELRRSIAKFIYERCSMKTVSILDGEGNKTNYRTDQFVMDYTSDHIYILDMILNHYLGLNVEVLNG